MYTETLKDSGKLINVKDYSVKFRTYEGKVSALDRINFELSDGEIMGIIGESGSGKSTVAMSLLGLLPENAETRGEITYLGTKINETVDEYKNRKESRSTRKILDQRLAEIRWKEISVIFQGAMNAFNPVYTIKKQIMEVFKVHGTFDNITDYSEEDLIDHETLRRNARKKIMDSKNLTEEESGEHDQELEDLYYNEELKELKLQIPKMNPKQKKSLLISKTLNNICYKAGFNPDFLNSYPHQLSGGMRQRAIIAMALALNPRIVIADEPTTGLDVVTQAKIIKELKGLRDSKIVKAMIVVSHDVGVVAQLATKVIVMYAGRIMEQGRTEDVFNHPKNPYTIALLKSYPSIRSVKSKIEGIPGSVPDLINTPNGCFFASRCFMAKEICREKTPEYRISSDGTKSLCHFSDIDSESYNTSKIRTEQEIVKNNPGEHRDHLLIDIQNVSKFFDVHSNISTNLFGGENKPVVHAVDGVSFQMKSSQIIGVVGESGSGKSTLGELVIDSIPMTDGNILFYKYDRGNPEPTVIDLNRTPRNGSLYSAYRKNNQIIFQDPYDSLNPKMTIFDIVSEPLSAQKNELLIRRSSLPEDSHNEKEMDKQPKINIEEEVTRALDIANLRPPKNYLDRYPHELSGGERQRVSIARAITLDPSFLVADEPISMLDVSIRANILNLLVELKEKTNTSILYISHDIASARYVSDHIIVMYLGKVVEFGPSEEITANPLHPYTKALISSVPSIDPNWAKKDLNIIGEIGSAINPHGGCRFYDRCVFRKEICRNEDPPKKGEPERYYFCHFEQDELRKENLN